MVLVAVGIAMLALGLPMVALALVLYGAGNGIYSIARGTVPLALFEAGRYAPLVGRLARPGLPAQAAGPLSRFRKSAPRFSDKNLQQNRKLSGRSVGLPTQVCLVGAFVITHWGADATYGLLIVLALANVGLALSLWRLR